MFGKNQRIYNLTNTVEKLQRDLERSFATEKIYRESYVYSARKLQFAVNRADALVAENRELKSMLERVADERDCLKTYLLDHFVFAPLTVGISIEDALIPTEAAGDITLEELAKLVVDGKPIERMELVPIKIGMYKGERSDA